MLASTQKAILAVLEELSESETDQLLDYVAFLQWQRQQHRQPARLDEANPPSSQAQPSYYLRDLTGKLAWKGDAVQAQQDLRREW